MSFSISDIKAVNVKSKRDKMSELGKAISSYLFLTENIKGALWEYVRFRIFKCKFSNFSSDKFCKMINELVEYVTGKEIDQISFNDVLSNENQFIYEIARAIYYKNFNGLYCERDLKKVIENRFKDEPKEIPSDRELTSTDLEEYFRRIMK